MFGIYLEYSGMAAFLLDGFTETLRFYRGSANQLFPNCRARYWASLPEIIDLCVKSGKQVHVAPRNWN